MHRVGGAGWWLVIAGLAVVLGRLSTTRTLLVLIAICMLLAGALVLGHNGVALVVGALAALAWGSSQLPLQSLAYPMKFGAFAVIATTAIGAALAPTRRRLPIPVGFSAALFGFLTFALASAAWSIDPSFTAQRAISMFLLAAAVCFGIPSSLAGIEDVKRLYYWAGIVLGAASSVGFILASSGVVAAFNIGRFQGIFIDANTLGYFAAPILSGVVLLAAQLPAGRRRRLLIAAIAFVTAGIAISGSRGGVFSSAAGILIGLSASQLIGQSRVARRTILIGVVIVAVGVLVFPLLGVTARVGGNGSEGFLNLGTGSLRTITWREATPTILQEPLVGHGFGTTPTLYPQLQSHQNTYILGGAHDGYIDTALELGLLGSTALIALAASGLVAAFRLCRTPGLAQDLGPILLAAIAAGIAESLVESGILNAGGLFAFPFWMAVALAHSLRTAQIRGGLGMSQELQR
jgi:O-antigen ligase